jgi:GT2 family glycosyltransferase
VGRTSVSVVIVNYRTPELTERAVQSALLDGASQVVVVDNESGDDSLERLRAVADPRVLVIASSRNDGFGSGANQGAAQATGDVIVFLNSDARLRQGALTGMADAVGTAGGRAIIGPRLIGGDGEVQRSAGLVPKPDDLVIRGLGLHRLAHAVRRIPGLGALVGGSRIATEYDQAVTATAPIDVTMISGACLAVGREAFAGIGGFDERFFMYFEDADLCRRASRAGWPIRYLPAAVVDHVGGASSHGDYRFGPMHGPSMTVYLRQWHGRAGACLAVWLLACRAIGLSLRGRDQGTRARTALSSGVRAYREDRTRSPRPRSIPRP